MQFWTSLCNGPLPPYSHAARTRRVGVEGERGRLSNASFLRHTRTEERPSAKPPRDLAAAEPDMRGVGEEGDAP